MKKEIIHAIKSLHPAIGLVEFEARTPKREDCIYVYCHPLSREKHQLIPTRILHLVCDFLKENNLRRSNLGIEVQANNTY